MLKLAMKQMIGNVRVSAQLWARDYVISGRSEEMDHMAVVPSVSERYPFVDGKRSENVWLSVCDSLTDVSTFL